jgi:hypothetical protein
VRGLARLALGLLGLAAPGPALFLAKLSLRDRTAPYLPLRHRTAPLQPYGRLLYPAGDAKEAALVVDDAAHSQSRLLVVGALGAQEKTLALYAPEQGAQRLPPVSHADDFRPRGAYAARRPAVSRIPRA